jgi:hypothetical protein
MGDISKNIKSIHLDTYMYCVCIRVYISYTSSVFLSIQSRDIYHNIKLRIPYQERLWICERNDPGLGTAEVAGLHINTNF